MSALPEAKVINTVRDPSAICWSNFKTNFSIGRVLYSNDLTDIVDYYVQYSNIIQYWKLEFEHKIFELDYDFLTQNKESMVALLLNFLGLNWDERCLSPEKSKSIVKTASKLQVNREIYQGSSKNWRVYEDFVKEEFLNLTTCN